MMPSSKVFSFLFVYCLATEVTTSVDFNRASQGLTAIPVIDIPINVELIDLQNNKICTVDPLPTYPFLDEIDIERNCLATFPNFCNINETLTKLDVSSNKILDIPDELIQCLKNLEALKLGDNQLAAYPEVTSVALTFFSIAGNNFKTLPPIRNIAPNVETVQLSGNPLNPDAILEVMGQVGETLATLSLGGIDLNHLDVEKLELFQRLEYIKLDQNQFVAIPELGGKIKESLKKLTLNGNPIVNVHPQELREFVNLVKIEFINCQITRIPELCQIKPGLVIDLSDNPLVCDCHAKELKMAAEAGVVIISGAPCQEPAKLQNSPLIGISVDQLNCPRTDSFREFALYQTNPELFSCGMMKAAITVVQSSSAEECSTECINQPACGGFHQELGNCHLFEFGLNHPDNITVSINTFIIN